MTEDLKATISTLESRLQEAERRAEKAEARLAEIEGNSGDTAVETARRILTYLGYSQEVSSDPGADPRRDRVAAMVASAAEHQLSELRAEMEAVGEALEPIVEIGKLALEETRAEIAVGEAGSAEFEGAVERSKNALMARRKACADIIEKEKGDAANA